MVENEKRRINFFLKNLRFYNHSHLRITKSYKNLARTIFKAEQECARAHTNEETQL